MIYAAILAGGVGRRMVHQNTPKQFISIGGVPIILRTLRVFLENERLDRIYIPVHPAWKQYLKELLMGTLSIEERGRVEIIDGGSERLDSFVNVLNAILDDGNIHDDDVLICHDSVRPFVQQQMIDDCINCTIKDGLALTVIPVVDTIHVSRDEHYIESALDRSVLYNGQTPSGFRIDILKDVLAHVSDREKHRITGTTQLLLQQGYRIRIVQGKTSNFKITTDNDLDIADRMIRSQPRTRRIELLDCTLRDGGIVVDFNYGMERMQWIKHVLETSGVEFIECGYIDAQKGSPKGRSCFDNERSIEHTLLAEGKKAGVSYLAMIDYGTYDFEHLSERTETGIDGIRLAFHKEHWRDALDCGKRILERNYDLYIQPMVSMRYDVSEFRELIQACNSELREAKGFYIVDSFGQMDNRSLLQMMEIADQYVAPSMRIGFHAHNNRQMAYSNALAFLEYNARHDVMLDASILGMGKGAGNLCTELIEERLINEGKHYNSAVIYESISEYFEDQQKKTFWGYSLDYYLSSLYSCTPSYIKIFAADPRVTTDVMIELLRTIPNEKKAACDRNFAMNHLHSYFEVQVEEL